MSVRKEVELIIKQNITKRTRINHFDWDPCATSTPVRKPLNILDNFEPGFGYNQSNVISRNISFKTTPKKLSDGQNYEGNSRKKIVKKNKPRSRGNSFYRGHNDDDDDEESDDNEHGDCIKDNGSKKNLIIKLGSDEFDNKRIKRTNGGEVKREVSQNLITEGQNEIMKNDVTCRSANNKTKPKARNSNKTVSKHCAKREKTDSENSSDNGIIETTTNAVVNDSSPNDQVKNEKGLISDQAETKKDTEVGTISCKRKNNISGLNHVNSKKSKSDPKLKLNKGDGDPVKVKNIENGLDKSIKERKTKLSNSHEIFSESKERELRESLDMTATSVTEKCNDEPELYEPEIIQVLQKKQIISKKRSYDSKNKMKLKKKSLQKNKIDSTIERSKRAVKSLKHFWPPKSENNKVNKDSILEVNDIESAKEVEPTSPSTTQQGETESQKIVASAIQQGETGSQKSMVPATQQGETGSKKIMASNNNGSSNSSTNKDFFNIKEMEFTEIPSNGNEREVYSYAVGWKFPAFKCGALKIGSKCESSGRTEHENSHFGGVLLEGKLLMKIQENEVELSSGQMFCVPPLTDWRATNITRKDCIVYYWCGRF